MAEFVWAVSTGAAETCKPATRVVRFGDGYEQRRATGINAQLREWTVTIDYVDPPLAAEILAFLSARGGVETFTWWTNADEEVTIVCEQWDRVDTRVRGVHKVLITAKFREVVA